MQELPVAMMHTSSRPRTCFYHKLQPGLLFKLSSYSSCRASINAKLPHSAPVYSEVPGGRLIALKILHRFFFSRADVLGSTSIYSPRFAAYLPPFLQQST